MPQNTTLHTNPLQADIDTLFCNIHAITGSYAHLAKQLGVSYNTLAVLYCIYTNEQCTQKTICDNWWLPKQTVNNLTREMHQKGWLILDGSQAGRGKCLTFTDAGLAFAEPIVKKVMQAEQQSFEEMGVDAHKQMIEFTARYQQTFARIAEQLNQSTQEII